MIAKKDRGWARKRADDAARWRLQEVGVRVQMSRWIDHKVHLRLANMATVQQGNTTAAFPCSTQGMQQHPRIWMKLLRSHISEGEMFEKPSVPAPQHWETFWVIYMCLFRASKHNGACHTGREALMQDSPTSALGRGRSQQTEQRFSPDETNLFHFLSSVSETANYCFTFQQTGCRLCLNAVSKTHVGLKRSCIRG